MVLSYSVITLLNKQYIQTVRSVNYNINIEDDPDMVTGNMHKKIWWDQLCNFWVMTADTQTDLGPVFPQQINLPLI